MDESAKGPGPCPVPDEASHTQQAVLAANQFWRVEWRGVLGEQGGGRNGCRGVGWNARKEALRIQGGLKRIELDYHDWPICTRRQQQRGVGSDTCGLLYRNKIYKRQSRIRLLWMNKEKESRPTEEDGKKKIRKQRNKQQKHKRCLITRFAERDGACRGKSSDWAVTVKRTETQDINLQIRTEQTQITGQKQRTSTNRSEQQKQLKGQKHRTSTYRSEPSRHNYKDRNTGHHPTDQNWAETIKRTETQDITLQIRTEQTQLKGQKHRTSTYRSKTAEKGNMREIITTTDRNRTEKV